MNQNSALIHLVLFAAVFSQARAMSNDLTNQDDLTIEIRHTPEESRYRKMSNMISKLEIIVRDKSFAAPSEIFGPFRIQEALSLLEAELGFRKPTVSQEDVEPGKPVPFTKFDLAVAKIRSQLNRIIAKLNKEQVIREIGYIDRINKVTKDTVKSSDVGDVDTAAIPLNEENISPETWVHNLRIRKTAAKVNSTKRDVSCPKNAPFCEMMSRFNTFMKYFKRTFLFVVIVHTVVFSFGSWVLILAVWAKLVKSYFNPIKVELRHLEMLITSLENILQENGWGISLEYVDRKGRIVVAPTTQTDNLPTWEGILEQFSTFQCNEIYLHILKDGKRGTGKQIFNAAIRILGEQLLTYHFQFVTDTRTPKIEEPKANYVADFTKPGYSDFVM